MHGKGMACLGVAGSAKAKRRIVKARQHREVTRAAKAKRNNAVRSKGRAKIAILSKGKASRFNDCGARQRHRIAVHSKGTEIRRVAVQRQGIKEKK